MNFLSSRLFQLARSDVASSFIGYAFEYASSLIPVRRLFEDRTLIAFHHPVPFWDIHYLIVPKRRIPTFMSIDLTDRESTERIVLIFQTAQALGRKRGLQTYSVLVNGGVYQDVPQLHFHVVSGGRHDGEEMYTEQNVGLSGTAGGYRKGQAGVNMHPAPAREFHQFFCATDKTPSLWSLDFFNPEHRAALVDILRLAQEVVDAHKPEGFTLLTNVSHADDGPLQFHLVSGGKPF